MSVYDLSMRARLAQSTTLILLGLLALGDGAWRLTQQKVTKLVDEAAIVRNIQKSVANKSINPDVLVVGSSLSYCFTYDLRDGAAVDSETGEPKGSGSNCDADDFLSKRLGAKVYVMSFPGAMTSDIEGVIESAFAEGKRPKVIVYTAAPRDFVDRLSPPKKTAVLVGAAKSASANPARPVLVGAATSACASPARLAEQLAATLSPAHARRWASLIAAPSPALAVDFLVSCASQIYEQRAIVKNSLVDLVCDVFNRDKDLWSAQRHSRAASKTMTKFDKDLANYAMRYQPPDFDRLKDETNALYKLGKVCAANGTRLIVINMPLSKQNKELLDKKLYSQYKQALVDAAKATTYEFADSDSFSPPFDRSKFLDSAHLNAKGSKQLQETIAPLIASDLK
jgi:hypothetical protein